MSQAVVTETDKEVSMELSITKVGKLGIEFRSTASPYFVINVSKEAQELYGVQPGDLLSAAREAGDSDWTEAEGLEWPELVEILKHRPAQARFKRFKIAAVQPSMPVPAALPAASPVIAPVPPRPVSPLTIPIDRTVGSLSPPSQPARDTSQRNVPVSPAIQQQQQRAPSPAPMVQPVNVPFGDRTSPVNRRPSVEDPTLFTVVYSAEGPLGLEFEDQDFPFKVGAVRAVSMSADKGVRKGDCLITVNGKSTQGMTWDELRGDLSVRPSIVVFKRDAQLPDTPSVWDIAAGLVRGASPERGQSNRVVGELQYERDELKAIIASLGAEDIDRLRSAGAECEAIKAQLREKEASIAQLMHDRDLAVAEAEEERVKNEKLVEVIDEIEKSQLSVIERFEQEIRDRDVVIQTLRDRPAEMSTSNSEADAAKLEDVQARLELMEKDNTRLRNQNTELGIMVQQCLEKIQKDLSDKPHWVDRRVVCSAIATLLREVDSIDENSPRAAVDAHTAARQRLGDVLGLTNEERTAMGLLALPARLFEPVTTGRRDPSIGEDFVSFLERESGKAAPVKQRVEFSAAEEEELG